jgi:septal ring factor EnvC (AmiA/AmiB activator)
MTPALRRWFALALLALFLLPQASAQQAGKSAANPEAQRRLENIQRELKDVAAERRRLEGQRGAASRELRAMDERVASSSRALYEAENELAREQTALAELGARRNDLLRQQATQRRELAALLRAAHAQGDQAPLKLVLAQDRVADAQRQLVYYRYLQRQRLQRTAALSAELAELERVEAQIAAKRSALDAARERQRAQLAALARDRRSHAATLSELEQRYRDRQAREQALGSDAKALQQVVARLRAAAAKAAAERAAARRAEAQRAEAQREAGNVAARTKPPATRPGTRVATPPPRQTAKAAPVRVGGFGWPLSGNLLAGYGGRMPDGRASHGLLISAGLGTPVRAVADGSVVFAEWMTGYGLILIVDHGNGYLSLYAHNESLLKDVGAAVKRGDAVARVGNSGGLEQPALYFELRRNGQPVDPGSWLRRQ